MSSGRRKDWVAADIQCHLTQIASQGALALNAKVMPGMLSTPASTDENACSGWKAPGSARCAAACSRSARDAAPEQWTAACPLPPIYSRTHAANRVVGRCEEDHVGDVRGLLVRLVHRAVRHAGREPFGRRESPAGHGHNRVSAA